MAKLKSLFIILFVFIFIINCSENSVTKSDDTTTSTENSTSIESEVSDDSTTTDENTVDDFIDYSDYDIDETSIINISLADDATTVDSAGVSINGNIVTIYLAGTYQLSGTLTDGQIVVVLESPSSIDKSTGTTSDDIVKLILNNVNIHCATNAAIFAKEAEKTIIILADDSENYLSDGATYVDEDDANATLYCKTDLLIYGNGTLNVTGNYNDGITGKDGLVIRYGNFIVNAADDGIRGKDYLEIEDGRFTIDAGGDGLKSDNEDDVELGYIAILGGTFEITTAGDGIAAETKVLIDNGNYTITTAGGSSKSISDEASAKGIKAGNKIVIDDGEFIINTAEDGIHTDSEMEINGGNFTISAADDGLHTDVSLIINGGDINVTKCYEGVESVNLTINGGNISVVSSDDGINAAGANSGNSLNINGGYIYVNAQGDGIDCNGSITMTDGIVIVHGPTNDGNGALDYDASFKMTGGFLVAAGSSGMAQAPSTTSTVCAVLYSSRTSFSGGKIFHIETSSGEEILTFAPEKNYQSVVFSSPSLTKGASFNIYSGGSSTGTNTNGLYGDGDYTKGSLLTSFTTSSTITTIRR